MPKILRQASDGLAFARLKLHAINSIKDVTAFMTAAESCDAVQSHGRLGASFMGQSDFDAVCKASNRDVEVGMTARQMFQGLGGSGNDGLLQFRERLIVQPGGFPEKTRYGTGRGCEAHIGVNRESDRF